MVVTSQQVALKGDLKLRGSSWMRMSKGKGQDPKESNMLKNLTYFIAKGAEVQ